MMDDLQKAFDEGFEAVRGYVDRSFADFERRLGAIESRALPTDGRDGIDGQPGAIGERGEKGMDGKDGRDGVDGLAGEKGVPGDAGKDGAPGLPGRGVAKLLIDAKGHLVVTFTDGATDDVGLIVGKDGAPGKDGRDGVDGLAGADGKSGADGAPGRDGEKGLDGSNGRDGIDGANGVDGKSIEPEVVVQMVQDEIAKANVGDLVRKAVDAILKPENGKDGKDGRDGVDGAPGAAGERGIDGAKGLDGNDGAAGRDGKDGLRGEPGEKGLDGKDGVGLSDAVIDRDGNLVLTMTDGRHKALGLVLGKDGLDGQKGADGAPGRDGVDGLGFDDLSLEYDGERSVSIKFQRGDVIKEFPLTLPVVLDRGVWQERGLDGAGYKKGDAVTWSGQLYIARKDTFAKPDDFESWRLSVKRGKDAKEPVNLK